jgi:hypothetical protein
LRVRQETIEQAWAETKRNADIIWKTFQGEIKSKK